MFKDFILLFLVAAVSSKTVLDSTIIDFDVNQPFTPDNHEFTFSNDALESKFYFVEIRTSYTLTYEYQCQGSEEKSGKTSLYPYFIIKAQTGDCHIIITSTRTNEIQGTINIHPLDKEDKIDLDKYKYQITKLVTFDEEFPPLVFSLSKLTKNIKVKFTYWNTTVTIHGQTFILKNPYQICEGNETLEFMEEFKFMKGKDYKIKIVPEELNTTATTERFYLNGFSFYKIGEDGNLKANSLLVNIWIYFILLLLF